MLVKCWGEECLALTKKYPRENLVNYKGKNYCRKCYEAKLSKEKFAEKVCEIFRLKSPGPRIWAERKRLQEKFGYTDETIIMTLEYLFTIKKVNYVSESLCKINPLTVDEAKSYWNRKKNEEELVQREAKKKVVTHLVHSDEDIKKGNKRNLTDGWDDFFNF